MTSGSPVGVPGPEGVRERLTEAAALTTIECSMPGARYTLFESGPQLIVHLAGPSRWGTGPCICGFDRHASNVGFSVGGGLTGPDVHHDVCADCRRLAGDAQIRGTHAGLFAADGAR